MKKALTRTGADTFETQYISNMKKILAAVDFSKSSLDAVQYAAHLALALSARLHLLHVLQAPFIPGEVPTIETVLEEMLESTVTKMASLKESLAKQTGGKIDISTDIKTGMVGDRLEQACEEEKPWLVVMGLADHSGLWHIVGSNTLRAAGHLSYPLVVVPENTKFHPIRRIGIACDLKDHKGRLPVDWLRELQQAFDAEIDLFSVNVGREKIPTLSQMNFLIEQVKEMHPKLKLTWSNKVEKGINKLLIESGVDLLLVIPGTHSFLEFHRSRSRRMILHSPVPVMVVREQG